MATLIGLLYTKPRTKEPTGLSIKRNGNKLAVSWKIADKNHGAGQQIEYYLYDSKTKNNNWVSVSVGKTATSKTITIPVADYYPDTKKTLDGIAIRIRGRRSSYTEKYKENKKTKERTVTPSWSQWVVKEYMLAPPPAPSVSASWGGDQEQNVTTFSWSVNKSDTNTRLFRKVEYQTKRVKDCVISNGWELDWSNSVQRTANTSGSITETEDSAVLANGSYTRWYRFRSVGPRGDIEGVAASVWKYVKHVYAQPYMAKINSVNAELNKTNGFNCNVKWTAATNEAHPIDETTVQYSIAVPAAGLTCPAGASWTDAGTIKDTPSGDGMAFSVDDTLDTDECLFIRVNTKHDSKVTYGVGTLAYQGKLADPTITRVETDPAEHTAIIEANNTSSVTDSFLAVIFKRASEPSKSFIIGVIPHGSTSCSVQCPDWGTDAVSFGVYAVVGSYKAITRSDGASSYSVTEKMRSQNTVWEGGAVPLAPTGVNASSTDISGTVRVEWNWNWSQANIAEISWSDHPDAWESTDEPDTYRINSIHASHWNISGLETGMTWYVRVRLIYETSEGETAGDWSTIAPVNLSSAPNIPTLVLSDTVITEDGSVTASWGYSTTDGTAQAYAEICEAEVSYHEDATTHEMIMDVIYGDVIAHTDTAQHVTIYASDPDVQWQTGETYNLCVRVLSASGVASDSWSDPVAVTVAEPLTCTITQTSLETITVIDDDQETRTVTALTALPLTVTVTGAGPGGTTILAIERAESYYMARPDETRFEGHKGETVFLFSQTGEDQIEITAADLINPLDDGASYRIIASVKDGLGQSAETPIDFEVHWSHQAIIPMATVEIIDYIAKITPVSPTGALETDTCDIYRLSADRPELIFSGAEFGTTYVDPYPAIGEYGGHRIVFKTANGDYITEDNHPAWIDTHLDDGDYLELDQSIIDFGGDQLLIRYNLALSNSWSKDFTETKYLGGSVQGDWNAAVSRTGTVTTVVTMDYDQETVKALRRLAVYPGICHIRTPEGSSYPCDIQVSDDISYEAAGKLLSVNLKITRVDPEGYDGMTLEQWEAEEQL